jgi:hypothetical protein
MPPPAFNDHGVEPTNGHTAVDTAVDTTVNTTKAQVPATNDAVPAPAVDLTKLVYVEYGAAATFTSRALSLVSLARGTRFAPLVGLTGDKKSYATLQISRTHHVQLNSELLYCNHSCAPSLEFDTTDMVVRVARGRDLTVGEPLTFWYPSTEWEMAQPFACTCGAKECKGRISGASDMSVEVLGQYWLNEHIEELLAERKGKADGKAVENGH